MKVAENGAAVAKVPDAARNSSMGVGAGDKSGKPPDPAEWTGPNCR